MLFWKRWMMSYGHYYTFEALFFYFPYLGIKFPSTNGPGYEAVSCCGGILIV